MPPSTSGEKQMGDLIEIRVVDGHRFKAYRATPKSDSKGTLIVAPEIFGVNDHIRSVADGFAADGYLAVAPQLFDRSEPDYEAGYEQTDIAAGLEIISDISLDASVRDIEACIAHFESAGPVALVGYCSAIRAGQRGQEDDALGHHVAGQDPAQRRAHPGTARPLGRGHHVRHQPVVPRLAPRDAHGQRLAHVRQGEQRGVDLAARPTCAV